MTTTQEEDEELWNDNFYRLSALKEKYGQAVKLSYPTSDDNELSLNQWWQTQKLELDPEDPVDEIKIDALASIGYSVKTSNNYLPNRNSLQNRTDVVVEDWHSRYQSLAEFYQKHGHCNVPKDYPHDNILHQWMVTQREGEFLLPPDKKQKLDQLGFFDVVLRPRLLKVWVPPGSIGLGIGTQNDGLGNYISKVRSDSVLKDRIFVGDHLLAVDDTDVREMTCHEIADLLLQKSKNKRLLSIHTDSNSIQEAQNNIHNDVEGETKEGEDAKMSDNDIDVLTNPTAASCIFDLTESSDNQKSKNKRLLSFYTDSISIQNEQKNIHNDVEEETNEDEGAKLSDHDINSSSKKNNDEKELVENGKSSKQQQEGENDSTKGEEAAMGDCHKPDSPSLEEKCDLKIPKTLKDHNATGSYWVAPTTKRRRTTPSFDDSSKKLQQQQISPKQAAMKDLLSPSDANEPSNVPILSPSDANEPSNAPISNTTSHDVLFGRGNMINGHPGNRRFRDIIASHIPEYVRASKGGGKLNVASKIVRAVRLGNPPGRFLRIGPDNMWRDVGDKVAVEKTSQAIRDRSNVNKRQRYAMRESHGDSVALDGTMQMKRINQKLTLLPSKVSNVEVIDVDAMEDDDHCKVSFGTKIKTNNSPLRQKPTIYANDNGNHSKQNGRPIASGERKRKISESSCSDGLVVATTAAAAVRNRSMEDSGIIGSRIFSTEENDPYLKSLSTLIAQLDQDKETLLQLRKRRRMFLAKAKRLPDPETTMTPQEEWL